MKRDAQQHLKEQGERYARLSDNKEKKPPKKKPVKRESSK